jgi:flagellar biogenesis protein FliO
MISSLVLLTASVFATPVVIADVKAAREDGHLRVEVSGDSSIDPDGARTKIDEGHLLIYLPGTRVRADNRSWDLQDGAGEIRAHRHKTETELVVPLSGNGCSGPVELTETKNGITALVGCDGAVASPKGSVLRDAPIAINKAAAKSKPKEITLKALVELPPDAPAAAETSDDTAAPAPVKAGPTEVPLVAAAKTPASNAPAHPVATKPATTNPAPLLPTATATTPATPSIETASSGSGLRSVAVPGVLLMLLAGAAYVFAKKRRTVVHRHIQILETASLGPKRSLIVARIGEETLILGTSEAGITLLKGSSVAGTAAATATDMATISAVVAAATMPVAVAAAAVPEIESLDETENFEISQPLEEALADIPEPDAGRPGSGRGGYGRVNFRAIEGGLAGLFNRRGAGDDRGEPDRFEDLLEDSVEDQELRQKLAAGMSARVR